jgi:hypothetical protein
VKSYCAEVRVDSDVLMFASASRALIRAAGVPSTLKVTRPHLRAPPSWTRAPASVSRSRRVAASDATRVSMAGNPQSRA